MYIRITMAGIPRQQCHTFTHSLQVLLRVRQVLFRDSASPTTSLVMLEEHGLSVPAQPPAFFVSLFCKDNCWGRCTQCGVVIHRKVNAGATFYCNHFKWTSHSFKTYSIIFNFCLLVLVLSKHVRFDHIRLHKTCRKIVTYSFLSFFLFILYF